MSKIVISSATNQTIKDLVRLKDRKGERAVRSFVVEGFREINRAVQAGFLIEDFFYCEDELQPESRVLMERLRLQRIAEVSKDAFAKVATRDGSDGLIGVFKHKKSSFDDVKMRAVDSDLFIVVIENVEKPGNLGAILRSADAAGVHGVIVLGAPIDVWNPNVIRSSLGGVFSIPVIQSDLNEFLKLCGANKIKTIAAALRPEGKSIFELDLRGPLAVILGSEAHGLSEDVLNRSHSVATIPMLGRCDSLNISVAAGIFMYEALRQRAMR
jgi:TrmH family RNA methyltransferase